MQRMEKGTWRQHANSQKLNRILKMNIGKLTDDGMKLLAWAFSNLENLTIEFDCDQLVENVAKLASLLKLMDLSGVKKFVLIVPKIGHSAKFLAELCNQLFPCFPAR